MVKKFEEFISEGLWSKGVERSETGEERLGEKLPPLFKEEDVYEVKGFPGYYISPRGEYDNWVVYHAPDEEPICEYENLAFVNFTDDEDDDFIFSKGHEYWEDYTTSNDISDKDYKLMTDDDFIEAIYHTICDEEE